MSASPASMPSPSSVSTPYCRARSSRASGSSNSHASRSVTSASLREAGSGKREAGRNEDLSRRESRKQRIELGDRRQRSSRTSPVETSAAATPTAFVPASRFPLPASRPDRADEVVPRAVEQVVGERDARRDRLDDFAPHDALGRLGIFDLLADRDAKALLHEPSHVVAGRLHRNAGERHARRAAVVPRRQREPEHARRRFGVVVEHLVKLAHAKKQDRVLVPSLDLAILLHERRLRRRAHLSSLPISVTNASIFFALSSFAAAAAAARVA